MKTKSFFVIAIFIVTVSMFSVIEVLALDLNPFKGDSDLRRGLRNADPGPGIGKTVRTNYNKHFEISIKNTCHKPIRVALHYKPINDGQSYTGAGLAAWNTKYFWPLSPGEKTFIETTRNSIVYFHAKSNDGRITWGKSNHRWRVNGRAENFFRAKMGNNYRAYTQNFTCN